MKELKNLKSTKVLNKKEQQGIKGGLIACNSDADCPEGYDCNATDIYGYSGVCFLSRPGWDTGN